MTYSNVTIGRFIERTNRFCAITEIDGKNQTVHVKNTGRLKELLIPGATVYLTKSDNPIRKTKFDLISVKKDTDKEQTIVNIDSQAANDIAYEWLKSGKLFGVDAKIRREVTHGNSRFDFYVEAENRKIFLEVKGCTLEKDGIALFPDAPTIRGVKHITELTYAAQNGFEAYILFIIQMKGVCAFSPNDTMHPEFGNALRVAARHGVKILAVDCIVTTDSAGADREIPVIL